MMRIIHTLAVGSDYPDAIVARGTCQLFLKFLTFFSRFRKPPCNNNSGLDPRLTTLVDGAGHCLCRNDHDCEIR